jgi:hypothetical protein
LWGDGTCPQITAIFTDCEVGKRRGSLEDGEHEAGVGGEAEEAEKEHGGEEGEALGPGHQEECEEADGDGGDGHDHGDGEPAADGEDLIVGVVHGAEVEEVEAFKGGVSVDGVLVFFDVFDEEVPALVGEEGSEGFDDKGAGIAHEADGVVFHLGVEGLESVEDDGGEETEGAGEGLSDSGVGVVVDGGVDGGGGGRGGGVGEGEEDVGEVGQGDNPLRKLREIVVEGEGGVSKW